MREISLADHGLLTVAQACERRGWAAKSVQNWVNNDLLGAVAVGPGRGTLLLAIAEVDTFVSPARGRPASKKKAAPKKGKKK